MAKDPVPEGFKESIDSAHQAFGRLIQQLSHCQSDGQSY